MIHYSMATLVSGVQVTSQVPSPSTPFQIVHPSQVYLQSQLQHVPRLQDLTDLRHLDHDTLLTHFRSQTSQMSEVELGMALDVIALMWWALQNPQDGLQHEGDEDGGIVENGAETGGDTGTGGYLKEESPVA
jgi:hypothetical protein